MLRIGRIDYANCTPIFHGLREQALRGEYTFIGGVPSHLNQLYALHPERYLILPDISISSIGPVGSVLLFSRLPIEELDGQTVLLSSESATSVNLLKILIKMRFGCTCRFSVSTLPLAQALQCASSMLLIGDTALRAALLDSDLRVYDLGDLWHSWTGLPFVFALWLCGRQVARDRRIEVGQLVHHLSAAKEHASAVFETIAQNSPEAQWMGKERLVDYWRKNLSFDLDARHIAGLILFYRYCTELGLLASNPELHFLTDLHSED